MGDYFNLPKVVSIILVIIPFTAWLCGAVTRFMEGKILAGLIRIFFFGFIIWVVDLIMTIIKGCDVNIWRLLNC